jgi:hypothetical protein
MVKSTKWIPVLVAVTACLGCGIEPETLAKLQEAVNSASGKGLTAENPEPAAQIKEVAFAPPYPDRINPFSFAGQAAPETQFESTSSPLIDGGVDVQVLGFANVDQPCVLLRIRGNTHSLSVGGQVNDVQVIAIRPPAADLRIGTTARTVTMFDSP